MSGEDIRDRMERWEKYKREFPEDFALYEEQIKKLEHEMKENVRKVVNRTLVEDREWLDGLVKREFCKFNWVEQLKESFRRAKRHYELVHGGTNKDLEIARIGLKGSIE